MIPTKRFVALDKALHDRKSFDCGNEELNLYLQSYALQHQEAGISKTFVLPARRRAEQKTAICAFYTLSHTEVKRESLPANLAKRLPFYPVPVLLIGQLALHEKCQGQGLGKATLLHALRNVAAINTHLPSFAVIVDAIVEDLVSFYKQYGFKQLDVQRKRVRLFLPMKTVDNLFK